MPLTAPAVLAEGIHYTAVTDPRQRGCLLTVHLAAARDEASAPAAALLTDLLTVSCADYPGIAEMTDRLDSLYAAELSAELTLCGDSADLALTASWLDDRFALNGEDITGAVLDLLCGCMFRPHRDSAAPDGFDREMFAICRRNLLDDIAGAVNRRPAYALQKAAETAFRGEPAAIAPQGSAQALMHLTPESVLSYWQHLLRTAPADIIAVLPDKKPEIPRRLRAAFSQIRREPQTVSFRTPSPCKGTPAEVCLKLPVSQTRAVTVYKYPDTDPAVMRLLCSMLGDSGNSLLFANVREKRGLCYDCGTMLSAGKQALTVSCGVRSDRVQALREAVAEQIAALASGDFPDGLTESCLLSEERAAAEARDTAGGIAGQIAAAHRRNDPRTSGELLAAMRRITKTQIMQAAASLVPDTYFLLLGTAESEREEATAE